MIVLKLIKKSGIDFVKLIDLVGEVGVTFESHFDKQKKKYKDQKPRYDEQKQRYDEQKVSESSKEYFHLKVLIIKEPVLSTDPILLHRLAQLKAIVYNQASLLENQQY
jgi:hypothetical protein